MRSVTEANIQLRSFQNVLHQTVHLLAAQASLREVKINEKSEVDVCSVFQRVEAFVRSYNVDDAFDIELHKLAKASGIFVRERIRRC